MEYKIGKEARCAVIGYGSWATAIVGLLAANEARVGWYVRNPEVLEGLLGEGRNPRYLSDVEFDRRRIAPSDDLDEVVREADIVILATPSAYLKTFLEPLTVSLQDKFVVSAIKGIVPGDYKTIVEYVHDRYAVGLGYGDNFLAVLIANSAGEMRRFLEESYPAERDTLVSGYLGDLLVTCYSVYSRNRRLGLLIGHGCTVKSALNEMTMVAEGYFAADCIRHINARHKIEMPIAEMVYNVLYQGASARKCMKELTSKLI